MSTQRFFELNALYWAVDRQIGQAGVFTFDHRAELSSKEKDYKCL
ncbi:MAG: hypothetical protein OEU84_07770 [Xanthomonadales bacterium]|nr:hypothetical protein [Xanthomonadales bacterium]